ncbi:protein FAM98A [Chironomus tepperi]|uniref:protein FAM98A n=1 Tax=Chironomus tepperi TaxID=113505 RepID=UPI00391F261C
MSYEIIESLNNVGYNGKLMDENEFSEAINDGFKNEEFRLLIIWLSNEISELGKLEEKITCSDITSFLIELSSFLKELQCSYDVLIEGNLNSRMQTVESRYILLEFLITELMSQKMLLVIQKPKDKGSVLTIHESPTAASLKEIAITLNLGKPPDNISAEALFNKINTRFDETIRNIPDGHKRIGPALFNPKSSLKVDQWSKIDKIHKMLEEEYNMRRKMLMTRLDVTIQSFKWSERIKGKEHEINERYCNKQQILEKLINDNHRTDIVALLAARDKLAIIEKTSSANVRKNTKSKLQRHIIGKVPDRGGRTLESQKPPPEMPSWQKRQPDRGGFNQNNRGNRGGGGFQQNQGYPQQQYQQKAPYNPSNQQYSGNNFNQQQYQSQDNNQGGGGGYGNSNFRGRGGRVQGNWNQRGQSYDNSYGNQQRDSYRGGHRR